jgi:UDP-N-acetylmuramate dehydrogenase
MTPETLKFPGEHRINEPLANYTTWRVGGRVKQLYKPCNRADLQDFIAKLPEHEPLIWLGLGSNTLIRDGGFQGTVIVTQGALKDIHVTASRQIYVEAGVSCATMARFCARNAFADGEFWAGIPGTIGGALRMNAGCLGHETWDSVISVETINRRGHIQTRSLEDFKIAYREVQGLSDNEWFLSGTFQLPEGNKEDSLSKIKSCLAHRAETQPINEYNCGSVFRNPEGDYAARLIEVHGLKGKQLGGAMVSTKHANFIINAEAKASASDIESLIYYIQKTIQDKTGILLHPEVHIIGDHL